MFRPWLSGWLVLAAAGCTPSRAAAPPGLPPGEVWLTPAEVTQAGVRSVPVEDHDIDEVLTTSGRVAFDEERVAHVTSPVSGRVIRIDAALGQVVKKGQVLALIQSPDLGDATSALAKAQADMIAAEHAYRRAQALRPDGAVSDAVVEQAEDAWRMSRAEAERAQEKVALFHAGHTVSESYPLTSPIAGTVLARSITPGFEIQGTYAGGAQPELFTIGDLDDVWVNADIYESDLARVHAGQMVTVSVVGIDKPFVGQVDYLADMLDPQTRTARLRCTIANPEHRLEPEMYATVRVSVKPLQALAIPRSALLHLAGQALVFVELGPAPDGRMRYERLPVTVDDSGTLPFVPIQHGLDRSERVVASGAEALSVRL